MMSFNTGSNIGKWDLVNLLLVGVYVNQYSVV